MFSALKFFAHLGDLTEPELGGGAAPTGYILSAAFGALSGNGFYNLIMFG